MQQASTPSLHTTSNPNLEDKTTINSDIEGIQTTSIDINTILISKIEAREDQEFKDPFTYNPNSDQVEAQQPPTDQTINNKPQFKCVLGERVTDTEGGDAGSLLKRAKYYP